MRISTLVTALLSLAVVRSRVVAGADEDSVVDLFHRSTAKTATLWPAGMLVLDRIPDKASSVEVATELPSLAPFDAARGGPYAHMEQMWLPALCSDEAELREVSALHAHSVVIVVNAAVQAVGSLRHVLLAFHCRCSKAEFMRSLGSLSKDVVSEMKAKNERELVCHYCARKHMLSELSRAACVRACLLNPSLQLMATLDFCSSKGQPRPELMKLRSAVRVCHGAVPAFAACHGAGRGSQPARHGPARSGTARRLLVAVFAPRGVPRLGQLRAADAAPRPLPHPGGSVPVARRCAAHPRTRFARPHGPCSATEPALQVCWPSESDAQHWWSGAARWPGLQQLDLLGCDDAPTALPLMIATSCPNLVRLTLQSVSGTELPLYPLANLAPTLTCLTITGCPGAFASMAGLWAAVAAAAATVADFHTRSDGYNSPWLSAVWWWWCLSSRLASLALAADAARARGRALLQLQYGHGSAAAPRHADVSGCGGTCDHSVLLCTDGWL